MILVTRDKVSSIITAKKLNKRGFKTAIMPLFKIVYFKVNCFRKIWLKFSNFDIVVLSSANAINYLQQLYFDKDKIKIYVVGTKTADKVRSFGYQNIYIANNSSSSLIKLLQKKVSKKSRLLYLCQKYATGNINLNLEKEGYKIKKIIAYKANSIEYLSEEILNDIKLSKFSGVTIYSKRTAQIFLKLIRKYNIFAACKNIQFLCFSNEICEYCHKLGFRNTQNIQNYF
ncbi:uroporphyrinogen-III synthase [Rickettsiales bacterium]|nr:uroporphyrinogen-III synthase [Rickettsiales bacterium]